MTEYVWHAPGGVYVVPPGFRERFLREFPDYRIRWSLKQSQWQIEQKCGRGALPPVHIDPHDDSLVRARDGYWLVMTFQPGDRMACGVCGCAMKVFHKKSKEATCKNCRTHGRDGRTMAAYWAFDEYLIEHLRRTDPLRGGITRAKNDADEANRLLLKRLEDTQRESVTSLDSVDYRWLSGIGSSTGRTRQVDERTFV